MTEPRPIIPRVRCPHCGSLATRVYTTRRPEADTANSRIQYRRCRLCELTFKTIIEPAEDPLPIDRRPARRRTSTPSRRPPP